MLGAASRTRASEERLRQAMDGPRLLREALGLPTVRRASRGAGIGLAVAITVATVVAVGAEELDRGGALFGDAEPVPGPVAMGPMALRQRWANVEIGRLDAVRGRVREGALAGLRLNMWPDAEFDAVFERMARTGDGYVLSGRLAAVRNGAATLVVNGDVVVGTVWTPRGVYDIRTVGDRQVVREVDVRTLPPLAEPAVRAYPRNATKAGAERAFNVEDGAADDGSVVDILVLWTAAAAKRAGGRANINALINLSVALANDAYARSGVMFRLSLVGTEQTDFPDANLTFSRAVSMYDDDQLAAYWNDLGAVRDRVGADIVTIAMEMFFGGFANLMHELSREFEALAYNFVHVDHLGRTTLAHEVGHNMGLQHDRAVDPQGGIFPYSHGYVNQRALGAQARAGSCWATIMAYLHQCRRHEHRLGVHVPYFSNPALRYPAEHGDPLGVAADSEFADGRGPADAVRSLNKARHVVANFRPSLGDRGGATDYGDTANDARAVSIPSTTRGFLEAEDVDFFRIDVPRSGLLRVETTGDLDTRGTLTSPEGPATLAALSDDNSGEDANFLIEEHVKAGTYLVEVQSADGTQGPYRLRTSLDWLDDDDDHGDSPATATRVSLPSSTEGLLGSQDVDYFRLDLAEAATLRVETGGAADTYGKLLWLDGQAVLEDDDTGEGLNFRIETALPAGAYLVEVRGFLTPKADGWSNPATGFYTLDVWAGPEGRNDDHGDLWATATPLSLPSTTASEIETPLDVDYFRIELPALGDLRVWTTGDTDTRGRLFAGADETGFASDWAHASNDDGGAGGNFLFEELLGARVYFLEVRGYRGATTGVYTLHVAFTRRSDDHGDTRTDATSIALPSSTHGTSHAAYDADYFRLELPEPGTLEVQITGGIFLYDWFALWRGERLVGSWATDDPMRAEKLPAGEYFIGITGEEKDLGILPEEAYTLDVSFTPGTLDDHGDWRVAATAIEVPSTTAAALEQEGDTDFFVFEMPEAGTLRVSTTGATDTKGVLFSKPAENRTVWRGRDDNNGEDGNFAIETALPAGRYYLRVEGADDETTGGYTLQVSRPPNVAPPPPPPITDDHGDAISTATVVSADSTTAGELDDPWGDVDVFQIRVPQDGVLRVETTGETDTRGRLITDDGVLLAVDNDDGAGLNFRIDRWVPAGTYFVRVRGDRATGAYALRVTFRSTTGLAHEHAVPLFLSALAASSTPAASSRQSLLRIINHSSTAGTVSIRAIDDSGETRGPVELAVEAGHAVHLDSNDLEMGNRALGVWPGVGPGVGDWRLRLGTNLDIEPLAYVSTADGFLTSVHELVPERGLRHDVPLFNPAGNRRSVSLLRLINAGVRDAEVVIAGVDDRGAPAPEGAVALTVPGGRAHTISARQLEEGDPLLRGRLGDGVGKWRLAISANRAIAAMSLVESADGKLANVSTRAATRTSVPLLLAQRRWPAQGFVRLVNAADAPGRVIVNAVDDASRRFGPLALALGAAGAAHFNSADLEQGNTGKGVAGVGSGQGDWRLRLETDLHIEPLAYARSGDGLLATMHDVVPSIDATHNVPLFNPASERDPASELRIVNPGEEDAAITIAGTDDFGDAAPGGTVALTLAAGEARSVTAQALEQGDHGLVGRLGDGQGRWRLAVAADQPIEVLNLLRQTDGQVANLSTSPSR